MWHCALPRTCQAEHRKEGYKGKQDLWRESLKTHSETQARSGEMERWRDHEVGAHPKTSEDNFFISLCMWGHLRICLPMASQCSAV